MAVGMVKSCIARQMGFRAFVFAVRA
jgi:hypothetical protein